MTVQTAPPNLPGKPIDASDYLKLLNESWIDEETARRAHLRRVDREEGANVCGKKAHTTDCSGVVFPIIPPWRADYSVANILRRDHPEIVYEAGKRKDAQKYICPPGGGNHFYFVPGTSLDALKDTELPIIITEGAKKVLALERLSRYGLSDSAERARFLPMGLMGVWNYRGVIGKEGAADGTRVPVKGIISDFEKVSWGGRRVVILYDSDAVTKADVRAAELKLGAELVKLGADVYIGRIPDRGEFKLGIDDFLVQFGHVEALQIIDQAKPLPEPKYGDKKVSTIIELIDSAEFFKSPDGKLWATLPREGYSETVAVGSAPFKSWLTSKYYLQFNEAFPSAKLSDCINLCKAKAEHDGMVYKVGFRLTGHNGNIYIDLGDDERNCIEITPKEWRVIRNPPVRFRRTPTMDALPWPVRSDAGLHELRGFLNAPDDENWCAMVAWLVGAFNPRGPYAALMVQGPKGAAKTTQLAILRSLIDPVIGDESDPDAGYKNNPPKDEQALMTTGQNTWVLSIDNLTNGVTGWMSDALCRVSTGGRFSSRALYTDGDEYSVTICRPMILNGIDDIANNADLADRSLIVSLRRIESYKAVHEFRAQFEEARPRIFGALLDAVCAALRSHGTVTIDKPPRMADFAFWVCGAASEGMLPFTPKQFMDTYRSHETAAISVLFEASPIGPAVREFTQATRNWSGTATELLRLLNFRNPKEEEKSKTWPKAPNLLTKRIRRDLEMFEQQGVKITERKVGEKKTRMLDLTWIGKDEYSE